MNKPNEPLIKLPLLLIRFHYPVHIPLGSMHPLAQPGQDAAQVVALLKKQETEQVVFLVGILQIEDALFFVLGKLQITGR